MCIRDRYKACYTEQMEKLHKEQAEEIMQGEAVPDDEQIHNLLEKKAAGGEMTEQENALLNIFCTAAELDSANASAKMNTTVTVSYTHLDVYKRQVFNMFIGYIARIPILI